jgi:hypothetical protein
LLSSSQQGLFFRRIMLRRLPLASPGMLRNKNALYNRSQPELKKSMMGNHQENPFKMQGEKLTFASLLNFI